MMIELRKFKRDSYDLLIKYINENISYYKGDTIDLIINNEKYTIEDLTEPLSNNEKIMIDISGFEIDVNIFKWKQNYEIGKFLHRKLEPYYSKYYGSFLEVYFWAYLAHINPFKEYLYNRFFLDNKSSNSSDEDFEEENEKRELSFNKKIMRYYFCKKENSSSSRIGLKFYWHLTTLLYDEKVQYRLSETAFSYIDSVKAIYERNIKKNNKIIKAFVEGILVNNKHKAFKDKYYRSIIPTHINNIAAINALSAYSYDELVIKISEEQNLIIQDYNESNAG